MDTPIWCIVHSNFMARKTYRDAQGYLRFIDSGKLVHRWTAERKLGRKLQPGEVVHHQNAIKTDNRYGNLRVFNSRKAHHAYHIKSAWTRSRKRRTLK
ncbi:MAG: HNH endonuclease [Candidatus Thorarchaeota archaeon]